MSDYCRDEPKYWIICIDNRTNNCSRSEIRCLREEFKELEEAERAVLALEKALPSYAMLRIVKTGELCKVDNQLFRVARGGTLDFNIGFCKRKEQYTENE